MIEYFFNKEIENKNKNKNKEIKIIIDRDPLPV